MKTAETLEVSKDKAIQKIEKEVPQLEKRVADFKVIGPETLEQGAKFLSVIRGKIGEVEVRRKFFVGPLNDHIKRINYFFKGITEPLRQANEVLEGKLLDYRRKEAERIAKKNEKIQEKAQAQAAKGVPVEEEPEFIQQEKAVDAGSFRKSWDFEIEDIKKIPREYLIPAEAEILWAIRVADGKTSIPGIKIFERESFARAR